MINFVCGPFYSVTSGIPYMVIYSEATFYIYIHIHKSYFTCTLFGTKGVYVCVFVYTYARPTGGSFNKLS